MNRLTDPSRIAMWRSFQPNVGNDLPGNGEFGIAESADHPLDLSDRRPAPGPATPFHAVRQ